MKDFSDLFTEEYNTQRDQWEKSLKIELKIEDVASKITKKHLDLGAWPTLSLKADKAQELPTQTEWKKASQSYIRIESATFESDLKADLSHGVRAFFFHKEFLTDAHWAVVEKTLSAFSESKDLEIYLLGSKSFTPKTSLHVVDESQIVSARFVHEKGGHNVHELACLTLNLIENLDKKPTHLALFVDSHFFKNIAKVRAMKLLAAKVFKEEGLTYPLKFITLNSYREWTLYERYSNMLRNNAQVASGYISGADAIQSSGYQTIFDLETTEVSAEHHERSLRMARNTSHILGLESMLGIVGDAAYGSYHLENLTHQYAEAAWKLMQVLLSMNASERKTFMDQEIAKIADQRLERVKSRKDVLAGMNDFPDSKEHLKVKLKDSAIFRVSRGFEEMRLKLENVSNKPKVEILVHGDYAALNARINFVKNYFELIGLEVIDPLHPSDKPTHKILVLCAKDEDYPALLETAKNEKAFAKYVAGKVDVVGLEAIHAGQNVYQVLSRLVDRLVEGK